MWAGLSMATAWAGSVGVMIEARFDGVVAERPGDAGLSGLGGGLAAGVQAVGPLWFEVTGDVTAGAGAPALLAVGGDARVFLLRRDGVPLAFSLVGGGGGVWTSREERVGPGFLRLGAAVDLRPAPEVGLRVAGAWRPMFGADRAWLPAAELSLGVVFTPRRRSPAVEVPEPVAPAPRRWLPAPDCRWDTPSVADASIRAFEASQDAEQGGLGDGATAGVLRKGGLVVDACPGDRVTVGEQAVEVDGAGLAAVYDLAVGEVAVGVVGAGRRIEQLVYVAPGAGRWVHFPCGSPLEVWFAQGDATVGDAERATLAEVVSRAGDAVVTVRGSFSPEGDLVSNRALALRRATAVRDVLVAAGMRPERVLVGDPFEPVPGDPTPLERLRRVVLTWSGQEGSP